MPPLPGAGRDGPRRGEQPEAEAANEVGLKERNFLSIETPRDAAGEPVKITRRGAATPSSLHLAGRGRIERASLFLVSR